MSPEQARGNVVDKRADIWAFGVVLGEMLTGRKLFQGEDMTDTLASVVKKRPDLSGVPAQMRQLLERCLEKDPKRRRGISETWNCCWRRRRTRTPAADRLGRTSSAGSARRWRRW